MGGSKELEHRQGSDIAEDGHMSLKRHCQSFSLDTPPNWLVPIYGRHILLSPIRGTSHCLYSSYLKYIGIRKVKYTAKSYNTKLNIYYFKVAMPVLLGPKCLHFALYPYLSSETYSCKY